MAAAGTGRALPSRVPGRQPAAGATQPTTYRRDSADEPPARLTGARQLTNTLGLPDTLESRTGV
jgi:hypothetical protein